MQIKIRNSSILGFFFVLISGILLHFAYEWSGNNRFVGLFSAVNESTWEHMKLLFMPSLIYFLAETVFFPTVSANLLPARTAGLLLGLAFIPIAFYSYSGILGNQFAPVNILIFVISVFLTFCLSYRITGRLKQPQSSDSPMPPSRLMKCRYFNENTACLILLSLFLLFLIFTYVPPQIGLFQDPVTGTWAFPNDLSLLSIFGPVFSKPAMSFFRLLIPSQEPYFSSHTWKI